MKRPYMNRSCPHKSDYEKKDVPVVIYSYYEKTPRDDDYADEDYEADLEDDSDRPIYVRDSQEKNEIRGLSLSEITLQSLLDNLPDGVKPSDVSIAMKIDCSAMAVEGTKLIFSYTKHFPARMDLYKQDKAAYDKEYAEYELKLAAYEKWKKQQEIKELEDKLSNLKR